MRHLRSLFLAALLVVFGSAAAFGQSALLDVQASPTFNFEHASPHTQAFTISSGASRCAVISVQYQNTAVINITGTPTYGGQNLTSLGAVSANTGLGTRLFWIAEAGIAAASSNIISVATDDAPDRLVIGAISFTNCSTVSTYTTSNGNTGGVGAISLSPAGTTSNDFVVAASMASDDMTLTAGTGRMTLTNGYRFVMATAPGSSPTVTWNIGTGEFWGAAAVRVEGGGGAPAVVHGQMMGFFR